MNVLALNIGSSTFKAKIFDQNFQELKSWKVDGKSFEYLGTILQEFADSSSIHSVVHRVVQGRDKYYKAVLINEEVKEDIANFSDLAPLHNPANLKGILEAEKLLTHAKQFAVFDTAFHYSMPKQAYLYAVPLKWYEDYHVRRYGFHGINHNYVANLAIDYLNTKNLPAKNIIVCHLGNGCSITAIQDGKSIDTSMGFTPLEGLVMGSRCGDIDPAIIFYIAKKEGLNLSQIEHKLEKESGLLGLLGESDVRQVLDSYLKGDELAVNAVNLFCYRVKKYIGAYGFALNGLDALVFSGGIGEHSDLIRANICEQLDAFSIIVDKAKNAMNDFEINDQNSKAKILVIPANEELQMVREIYSISTL